MVETHSQSGAADPRVLFAAERTLLAWVRTGLAMMGFGFVVARFGVFLRQIAAMQGTPPTPTHGPSLWAGTMLVLLGVAVSVSAAVKHWRTVRRLARNEPLRLSPFSLGIVVAGLLALLGIVMAAYLVFGPVPG